MTANSSLFAQLSYFLFFATSFSNLTTIQENFPFSESKMLGFHRALFLLKTDLFCSCSSFICATLPNEMDTSMEGGSGMIEIRFLAAAYLSCANVSAQIVGLLHLKLAYHFMFHIDSDVISYILTCPPSDFFWINNLSF